MCSCVNLTHKCFDKVGEDPGVWEGRITRSEDNGISWGPVEKMPAGIYGPVKNKPIVLQDGTILAGGSDEVTQCLRDACVSPGRIWFDTSHAD